jgi:hypothetical protein
MFNLRYLIVAIIIGLVAMVSCSDTGTNNLNNQEVDFSVNKEEAIAIAENFSNQYDFSVAANPGKTKQKNNGRKVDKTIPLKGKKGKQTFMYVTTYVDSGFVIVAGNKKVEPVLAYSSSGKFPAKSLNDTIPGGLGIWLNNTKRRIKRANESNGKANKQWKDLINPQYIEPGEPTCNDVTETVGPLLTTTWGQYDGYNEKVKSCGDGENAPTGCVATAMAQVMRYYEWPNTYNWSIMPDISHNPLYEGSQEIAQLMADIGEDHLLDMDYSCDPDEGSGAETNRIDNAFRKLGYSDAVEEREYSYSRVKQELKYKRPVIMDGRDNRGTWYYWDDEIHAWVVEGYRWSKLCDTGSTYLHFYMNWGWEGKYDGWYAVNDFTPGDYNFDRGNGYFESTQEMIVNIDQ